MTPSGRPRVAGLVLAVSASLLVPGCRGRAAAPAPETPGGAGALAAPAEQIVLFYPGDDTLLHRERREVPELPGAVPSRIKLVLGELLAGSREGRPAAFPWVATVEAVFVDRAGTAFVDLSSPPSNAVAGTAAEVALAYATVNTVVANCPGIQRVQLLFGGREVETLGHLDLSRPLVPRPELIAP
ncbi:MAG: GerMN domain-containing protein [Acidobacteria bacterium]|nr:GerMN domain-containing protein [Acidobacteriota bacterium]